MANEKLTFWNAVRKHEELSNGKKIDLENIKLPYILTNKLLMKEGTHNGVFYPGNELKDAEIFGGEKFSLFHDHADASQTWIGEIIPKNFDESSKEIRGDVVIVDKQMAMNLAYGAKLGLSPTIDVDKLERPDGPPVALDPQFISWSTVIKPAVGREIMLNSQNGGGKTTMETKDIDSVATRVVEMLAEKKIEADKNASTTEADTKVQEELDKMKADNKDLTEKLGKYDQLETDKQVMEIRAKEEFLSQKEDEYNQARDAEVEKMTPETREALSSALDKFIGEKDVEMLGKLKAFVSDYKAKNTGSSIVEAANAFRKEQAKLGKDEDTTESTETPASESDEKDGVSGRQSLSFDGSQKTDNKQPKKSKQELSDDFDVRMHAQMLKAQGGK